MTLVGKTAVVTGGSRGIGRAIVRRLAADGVQAVFSYRQDKPAADAVAADAVAICADQEDPASLEVLFEPVAGGLDILVNNAAVNPGALIRDITPGTVRHGDDGQREVLPAGDAEGRAAAARRRAHHQHFGLQHRGARAGPRAVCREQGRAGAVHQGRRARARPARHHRQHHLARRHRHRPPALLQPPEALERAAALTALGRLGRPADIADAVAFLVGPDPRWITGQNIHATGGFIL